MTVKLLSDITRRDSPILYRRQYYATAVVGHVGGSEQSIPVAFTIEHSAAARPEITVDIKGSLDYPVVPATRVLREYILRMDSQGMLP